jgi:hypothetical protein
MGFGSDGWMDGEEICSGDYITAKIDVKEIKTQSPPGPTNQ